MREVKFLKVAMLKVKYFWDVTQRSPVNSDVTIDVTRDISLFIHRENFKACTLNCEGRHESNASFFFVTDYNFNYNSIYIYHGYFLYKVEIIFSQSLLHYQHTFPTFA